MFYSGDGESTDETLALARGCDLVIHEAFRLDENAAGHGRVRACISFARDAGVPLLALVHMQRDERRTRLGGILRTLEEAAGIRALLPEPGMNWSCDVRREGHGILAWPQTSAA